MLETSMDLHQLHRAASAYYLDGLRQAEVADRIGVSRPSVSKLLAEARRIGMVRFDVLDVPTVDLTELAGRLRELLGVDSVRIAPGDQVQRDFRGIGDLLAVELAELAIGAGEVVLVSSGKTIHAVTGMGGMPRMPGAFIVPIVGGQQEPDPSFQTNETVRRLADRTGAQPRFLFAPARTSPTLWASLQADPGFRSVVDLWDGARAAIVGIGGPYRDRTSLTSVVPRGEPALASAAGDICLHFFDADGATLGFPGSEFLVRPSLETLRAIPSTIALAAGREKVASIRAGARARLFTTLITDVPTAEAVLAEAGVPLPS
ncbi:transcriptional regulator [Brachybacterium ginsengisoli]|uniref:Transcriptional regulator n=1 Tax=Brachybacterium ginsengisoli TaxID=1331682 RepID=A0A291GTI5_9MICO|nr:sugar-binding domain-containing protein [Brachybacterium ginsengisoli]ATG53543.1 transcriptional regulator [Brachybacterium ginsengisoli]